MILSTFESILPKLSSGLVRGTSNVMEALFGDAKAPFVSRRGRSTTMGTYEDEIASYVVPRTLLPWSVIFSPSTKMVRQLQYCVFDSSEKLSPCSQSFFFPLIVGCNAANESKGA